MINLLGTIYEPIKPKTIPEDAQWISGQGIGCWFHISAEDAEKGLYRIQRFTPEGDRDCDRVLELLEGDFDINSTFHFVHVSHCSRCKIMQDGKVFLFIYRQ